MTWLALLIEPRGSESPACPGVGDPMSETLALHKHCVIFSTHSQRCKHCLILMQAIATDVCHSVCFLLTAVSRSRMAEPIRRRLRGRLACDEETMY